MKLTMPRFIRFASFWLIAVALVATSCTKQQSAPKASPAEGQATAVSKERAEVIVSAAASTKDVLEALVKEFQSDPKAEIKINPGPSNGLANQILNGAPADLFLSASEQWAKEVEKGGQAESLVRLLTNKLVLVVPKDNPADVHEPKDLLSAKMKKLALAGEKVPAGTYADQTLTKLDLLKKLTDDGKIVRGQDVRTALAYVERGEAEAGIVYSTDVVAAANVKTVYEFDPTLHDEIAYVLVLLKHGVNNEAARKLFDFLQSPAADKTYTQFGFSRLH
jgi:molybdate transport system substrate-binding protein